MRVISGRLSVVSGQPRGMVVFQVTLNEVKGLGLT
jgi:hypothetical protein